MIYPTLLMSDYGYVVSALDIGAKKRAKDLVIP